MVSVLQVTPDLDSGGVERTTIEMAEAITAADGKAHVASAGGRLEPELERVGGVLHRLPMASKNPFVIVNNVARLERLCRAQAIDLIHARSRAPAWSAFWAARRLGRPFVTTYHGVYEARSPLKRYYNSIMARGDLVIANSGFTRAHVLTTYDVDPERVIAIPRGVDLVRFDPDGVKGERRAAVRAAWGLEGDRRDIILMAGRLTRWKGQLLAIEAFAQVEAAMPGRGVLVIAGDAQGRDSYVEELWDAARAAGVADAVRITEALDDMPAALASATMAIQPSLDPEAFGRVAIEAQAMRVAIIAAGHGGLAETVIDGETGLLFRPGEAAALAAAMQRLLELPEAARRRMGVAGRARVQALYSVAALQTSTLAVYDRLMERDR